MNTNWFKAASRIGLFYSRRTFVPSLSLLSLSLSLSLLLALTLCSLYSPKPATCSTPDLHFPRRVFAKTRFPWMWSRDRMWNATCNLAILKFHTGCAKGIRERRRGTGHWGRRRIKGRAVDIVMQASLAEPARQPRNKGGKSNGATQGVGFSAIYIRHGYVGAFFNHFYSYKLLFSPSKCVLVAAIYWT